ncbi:4'-phosphopantetheinyl transferase family protein [Paraburkholderia acidisoli]|uniref:4'-phosphopantetheinyl transferase superfamily protein n=1 Tax=Paraburkholderia acidisoli TaxID=2571748 RepID=A0A7Z2JER7_9BURK|nr:4'-phosphopantetheinyl transferase superfamily protein [Paraburkholderia acidisoli]QGZ60774.1 4'-phosphopantetheinyl transferase superfamily protein [Paraburkholderia acidisoli]
MPSSLLAPPAPHVVHVWQWDLDDHASEREIDQYWATLSPEERERAGKFRFDIHRRRYVAGRGAARSLLARYLALPPHAVAIDYGPEGKPRCATQAAHWTLHFNLSHSEHIAALAVANGFEIGIDVENVRVIEESLPTQVFSWRELAAFDALPHAEREAVFFETWARKEACLKALGTGFILPPDHFEFDLGAHGDTTPRYVGGDAQEAAQWRIRALAVNPACAGAVAARRTDWSIVRMNGVSGLN